MHEMNDGAAGFEPPGTAAERSALSPASLDHRAKEPDEYDDADPADPTARTAVPAG
jgi:hypothetical protein